MQVSNNVFQIGDLMQFTVRSAIEVGARFSSVERVHSYIEVKHVRAQYFEIIYKQL